MDPESATIQVKSIESKKQSLLGWYHSHPKFEVNPSHIDVINHEMYQKMFNEDGNYFIGLIISPYFSQSSDASLKFGHMPKIRCFITVQSEAGYDSKIVPYECQLNVIPQMTIMRQLLLLNILALKQNPNATDKMNLVKESCVIKCKGSK